ncbi:MAG: BMP family protein [Beijerinckiaceae bacterium]|nr:BMP family protein [Beijerinckiaceae bacterium]
MTCFEVRTISRRHIIGGLLVAPLLASRARAATGTVAGLFAGSVRDGGFMQAGFRGFSQAAEKAGLQMIFKEGVKPERDLLVEALRELARAKPDLIVAHGGQNNAAAEQVAGEFPDIPFAVTQGNVRGANLASYEVLQEHSAFLAGALAAWTTRTGVVGHMSGIRVTPGLKGRAGFANGVAHADPKVRLLTNFSGNQDDNALSRKVAAAMIDKGADVIFTMLNAGRAGAIDACRDKGAKQIGNVGDWVALHPDVFVGSAIADSGLAAGNAVADIAASRFRPGVIHHIGLEQPGAVRLSMAQDVSADIRARIDALTAEIAAGRLPVRTDWTGDEFPTPA